MQKLVDSYNSETIQQYSVETYRLLVESVTDYAIFLLDPAGTIMSWNVGAERIKGYKAQEILGHHFSRFYTREDLLTGKPARELDIALREGRYTEEGIRIRKDGSHFWAQVTITPLFDPPEKHIGFAKVTRDITERKQAEEMRRQHYVRLADHAFDPILTWELGGSITFWNEGAARLYGFSAEEATGRVSHELLQTRFPESRIACEESLRRVGRWEGELQHRTRDGRWVTVDSRMTLVEQPGSPAQVLEANRDITIRKRIENSLRTSEERFRLLIAGVKDYAIYMLDPEGKVLTWNSGAEHILGYSADEIVGQHYSRFFIPDDLARGLPLIEMQTAAEEGRYDDTGWRVRKDGSRLWANGVLTALYHDDGSLRGYAKITRDLTAQRRVDLLIRSVLDNTFDAIMCIDETGHLEIFNRAAERMFGYTASEVRGRNVSLLMPEPHRGEHDSYLANYLRTGEAKIIGIGREVMANRKDGSVFPADLAVSEFIVEEDNQSHFTGVVRDITEQRRLTAERDALLNRFQLYIERLPLAYVLFDGDLRIIDWNPAAERLYGYEKKDALGLTPFDLITPEFRPEAEKILNRIRAGDKAAHSINENLTRNRRKITCEWFNTPLLADDGQFAGLICLAQDLTEKMSLEAQLRQAQKMEAVGQLAGGVAHDFNNLLTIISGYSELLLTAPGLDEEMRNSITLISQAGERAASLTRQLLAFSRKMILEPKVLDLNTEVRETERMLRRLIGEDILLTAVLSPTLPLVKIDPGQLQQVLMNLAVNARDAMPNGGHLTIETRSVELDQGYVSTHAEVRAGRYVLLSMTDTGSGMSPEVKARIFEPFFTTKGVNKGTGLGLAVVHGVVKQSGGSIEVYSEVDIGTTFKIYLPVIEQATVTPKPIEFEGLTRGTETVLLVEDEDGVRGLALLILRMSGYTVLEARDGKEALRVVEHHAGPIDLLVTDVVMPEMGGRLLAESLLPRFPQMKVLYTSGYTDDAVVRHGLVQGQMAFLQKPYSPLALVKKIRHVLDEK